MCNAAITVQKLHLAVAISYTSAPVDENWKHISEILNWIKNTCGHYPVEIVILSWTRTFVCGIEDITPNSDEYNTSNKVVNNKSIANN